MTVEKFFAVFDERARANEAAGLVENLIEPVPNAVTMFEDGANGWRVEAYFDDGVTFSDLNARLTELVGDDAPRFAAEAIPDLNWVAVSQAALPPVVAGRFTIHGSHDRHRVPRGPGAILIDAGEAFGTAHHATTLGCLEAIDRLTRKLIFDSVLDLGCGTGVLAIAVARADPVSRIIATDLDPQSVAVAAENIARNGAAARIETAVASGLEHPRLRGQQFDLVIANILAGPLMALAPGLSRAVTRGGSLVLSGLLNDQAPAIVARYRALGFRLERHDRITGWSTLTLRRL